MNKPKPPTRRELRQAIIDAAKRLAAVALDSSKWQEPAINLLDATNKLKEWESNHAK